MFHFFLIIVCLYRQQRENCKERYYCETVSPTDDRGNPPQAMPFKAWSGGFFPGFSQKPRMDVPQNRKKSRYNREKCLLERGESTHQHLPWQKTNFCV